MEGIDKVGQRFAYHTMRSIMSKEMAEHYRKNQHTFQRIKPCISDFAH